MKLFCLCVVDGTSPISMEFTLPTIGQYMKTRVLVDNVQSRS